MPFFDVKTFYCTMCFRDLLDGYAPERFIDSSFICIDEAKTLRIFDGRELNHWIFTMDPIPQDPLFTIDLQQTTCSFDFRRVMSANRNHLFGRMRITGDFGSGLERLIFKFPIEEYNKIGPLILSFKQPNDASSTNNI